MEKFSQLKYERPDFEAFKKDFKKITDELRDAPDYEAARKAYFDAQNLMQEIETAFIIVHIRNDMDTADEFYDAERVYFNETLPLLSVLEKEADTVLAASPFRKDFEAEFGNQLFLKIEADIKTQSEEIIPELQQENALVMEYSKTAASCKTVFRGEECNFYGLLKHMLSTDRTERKEAFDAWAALYESASEKLDEIYDKLVSVRVKMAEKLGFSDYTELAYLNKHRFEYGPEEVKKFRENVLKYVVPAVDKIYKNQAKRLSIDKVKIYDEELVFPEGNASPIGGKDYLVDAAQQMYRELSAETGEFFDFMKQYELFDLETRPNKRLGGYCTELMKYKAPFIFSNFNGTSADVDVLTHEAGHAFAGFTSSKFCLTEQLLSSTSEINEIHSMSMEHFTYPWMDKMFGENADKYRYAHIIDSLKMIPYIICVDEFQHEVFANPSMKAAERRKVWRSLEKTYMPWRDYDGNEFLEGGGYWMQKQHIFMYPFYYIDYALAQMCAYEFYAKMKKNRAEAWSDYYKLCTLGGSMGYFELLKAAGLHNPFEASSVEAAVKTVMEDVEKAAF